MSSTEPTSDTGRSKIAWGAAIALYAACWFLPILDNSVGYDGARVAHQEFWKLLTEGRAIDSIGVIFQIIFFSIGWLVNELFLIGLVVFRARPRLSVRLFAFSLGIMLSWQLALPGSFPLLVGYWFWVAAGVIALSLSAVRVADEFGRKPGTALTEPVSLVLLLFPIANAAVAGMMGVLK